MAELSRVKKLMLRSMWKPKTPEVNVQCDSCPFRKDNDKEFGAIVARLLKSMGDKRKLTPALITVTRVNIQNTVFRSQGEFHCHHTVYDKQMKTKPSDEHRQCPGASAYWRNCV